MSDLGSPFFSIRSNVPGISWPPISHGPAADLAAMIQQLDRTQWMDPEAMQALQYRQLGILATHCEKHSPQFRRRLANAGLTPADLATPEGLHKLPVLRRRELQEVKDIFCEQVPQGHLPLSENRTSGSTGEPVMVRRTAVSSFEWHAMVLREHLWQKRDFRQSQCAIRANVSSSARLNDWGAPASLLFDTGPMLVIPIDTDIDVQIDRIAEFAPTYLLIYPNDLRAVARRCVERGIRLPSIVQIRTIGETLAPDLREEIRETFGVGITDAYSAQEIGHIACQCPDGPLYHVMAETVLVEILDSDGAPCPEGVAGRVVITDLHNFATPLIRYDIGDYAESGPKCACGRTLPTLKRILGRERNLLRLPNGTRYWPLLGYAKFREIAPVRQYQIVQDGKDSIEVRLVAERTLSAREEQELGAHIASALRYPFRMSFRYFDDAIPPGPSGKFEEFVCAIE